MERIAAQSTDPAPSARLGGWGKKGLRIAKRLVWPLFRFILLAGLSAVEALWVRQ